MLLRNLLKRYLLLGLTAAALTCLSLSAPAQNEETPAAVVPLWLAADDLGAMGVNVGDDVWLEVHYHVHPRGEAVLVEPAEKVWWIQQRPLLVLGAAGYRLPAAVLTRTVAWVSLHGENGALGKDGAAVAIYPRRDQVRLGQDPAGFAKALQRGVGDVNAGYLAQVSHFLAGNLNALDVQGSSYSVTGFGEVIDASGAWVGLPISGTGLWSEGTGGIFYDAVDDADDHVGIATADGTATLTVGGDDGVLFTGAFNQGGIPSEGAGTRLMWYPRKAAFRVGQVSSTTWNDVNVGSRSLGAGFDTTALGSASTAFGDRTAAIGSASVAMGLKATANGSSAVAIGNETTANAYASLVMGQFNLISGTTTSWVATDPALVIGNGTGTNLRANALTAYKNGNFQIAGVGSQPGGGTWADTADARLQQSVTPLATASALDQLTALSPVTGVQHAFGDGDDALFTGFLAQDVERLFPDWVVDVPLTSEQARDALGTTSVKGVQLPQAFFAHLVAAVQELKARNETLQQRVEALEAR